MHLNIPTTMSNAASHRRCRVHHGISVSPQRGWRRFLAWISFASLIFHLGAAPLQAAPSNALDADLHVVCTVGGMVPLDSSGGAADSAAKAAAGFTCIFCSPLLHLGPGPLPGLTSLVVAPPVDTVDQATAAATLPPRRWVKPAAPRAPPIPA